MFKWLRRAPLPPLCPVAGELSAHLFENARTGLTRGLFWGVAIDLEPMVVEGDRWDCSFETEWLTWPVRDWRSLDGIDLGQTIRPDLVEASLYLVGQHWPARIEHLRLERDNGAIFRATVAASAAVQIGRRRLVLQISFACPVTFVGVVVVRDNLQPKPATSAEATEALAPFIALDGLRDPRDEDWRYVFEPV